MEYHNENDHPKHALTYEEIEEFRKLIREETGLELSHQEAFDRATELITLVRMLTGPLPEDPDVQRQDLHDQESSQSPAQGDSPIKDPPHKTGQLMLPW